MNVRFAMALTLALSACGGSTDQDSNSSTGGGGADGGAGAAGSGGAVGGSGGVVGGSGGAVGGGGGAVGGSGGATGGAGGTGGGAGNCVGLDYCGCKSASGSCQVFAETCFCPCGVEPCEPDCSCACGGGKYLGCGPKDVMQPGALEGVWLIGWSGGMNHYSWVRFNADFSADVLDGATLPANSPFFACNGKGSWLFSAKLWNVHLTLPSGCTGIAADLTFESFGPASAAVKGAVLAANITQPPNGTPLEGHKFPASQCDAGMASCASPF